MAPFAPDGEALGVGFWETSKLNPKWIDAGRRLLDAHGHSFRASWGQNLSHIETKLTADSGAGIGTFFAGGEIVISSLYLSGSAPTVDSHVEELFLQSMRKVDLVKAARTTVEPFESTKKLKERPLNAVVIWENPAIDDSDAQVIQELSLHFAAAFFERT